MPFSYSVRPKKTPLRWRHEDQYEIVASLTSLFFMPPLFKDRLRTARERRNLSQAELATKAGLQPAAISHFETGNRAPSFENLKRLSDALNISVDYLLGRIDEEQHGQGLAAVPRARQLFRHAENLSDESFEFLETMAKALKEKEEAKKVDGNG